MDDGSDDFYRGRISASAFVALAPMSQRRDRHRWKAPRLKIVSLLPFETATNVPIVATCSSVSGSVSIAGLPVPRRGRAFAGAMSNATSSSGF